jgi:FixJ family two-component response regulator
MPKITDVVLVADDIVVRNALKFALEVEGLKVRILGNHAPLLVATDPVCRCLVLEHAPPRLIGPELLAILRTRHVHLRVVLYTSRPSAELHHRARELGGCEIVEMPFTASEFIDAVQRAVGNP